MQDLKRFSGNANLALARAVATLFFASWQIKSAAAGSAMFASICFSDSA